MYVFSRKLFAYNSINMITSDVVAQKTMYTKITYSLLFYQPQIIHKHGCYPNNHESWDLSNNKETALKFFMTKAFYQIKGYVRKDTRVYQ